MPVTDRHDHLDPLGRDECMELLRSATFGRVGYVHDGGLRIVPVNYIVDGERIVFRTGAGEKADDVPLQDVAFQVDEPEADLPWSVLVNGQARDVTTALGTDYDRLRGEQVPQRLSGHDDRWIAIEPDTISGRRLRFD